jgi:hypothetical protein
MFLKTSCVGLVTKRPVLFIVSYKNLPNLSNINCTSGNFDTTKNVTSKANLCLVMCAVAHSDPPVPALYITPLAMVRKFTPQKLANNSNQGFFSHQENWLTTMPVEM